MIQECEDDVPKWMPRLSVAAGWHFSAENASKLDEIVASLRSRHPEDGGPWKKLFECEIADDAGEANADEMMIVGELDADDEMALLQSQRIFSGSEGSQSYEQFTQVSSQTLDCIEPLKEALALLDDANKEEGVELRPDCLEIFVQCSPSQLGAMCSELDVENLSYKALATLFDGVVKCEKNLSLGWSTAFLRASILNRMLNLKQVPPRFFLVSVAGFAAHFPRAAIDGLAVPCVCHGDFSDLQGDVLAHLFTQNLSPQHQNLFLRKSLGECTSWNESTVSLMSNVLESKFEFSGELLDLLTSQLLQCTRSLDGSLKFGKFIQKLIASCGRQFSRANFDALTDVLDRNKTFLKKTCLNALGKHRRPD